MPSTRRASRTGRPRPSTSFWPTRPGRPSAYGRNAVYDEGHHGNAILSRFPILGWENEDMSSHGYERRGLLHCELRPPGWPETLHCVCVHLGLWGRHRGVQIEKLRRRIERLVPPAAPLIVAGDFNDWRLRVTHQLAHPLNLHEVFELVTGGPRAASRRPAPDVPRPHLRARLQGRGGARPSRPDLVAHLRPRGVDRDADAVVNSVGGIRRRQPDHAAPERGRVLPRADRGLRRGEAGDPPRDLHIRRRPDRPRGRGGAGARGAARGRDLRAGGRLRSKDLDPKLVAEMRGAGVNFLVYRPNISPGRFGARGCGGCIARSR